MEVMVNLFGQVFAIYGIYVNDMVQLNLAGKRTELQTQLTCVPWITFPNSRPRNRQESTANCNQWNSTNYLMRIK